MRGRLIKLAVIFACLLPIGSAIAADQIRNGWVPKPEIQVDNEENIFARFEPNCAILWTAEWCSSCKKMYPIASKLSEEGYVVYILDYDEETELAKQLKIKKLPTTIILTESKETGRFVGVVSVEEIQKVLKKKKKEEPAWYILW